MSNQRTVEGVQHLRGVAAVLVVISHTSALMAFPEYFGLSPFPIENVGAFGVLIFFVISGFIISIVSLKPSGQANISIGEFASRRFQRIVPFLWVCIVGYNAFTYLGTGLVEWGPALRAMVLWPIGDLKPNVTWTLRHEALFYALFATTLLLGRRHVWVLAIWCLAPLVTSMLAVSFPEAFRNMHPWAQDLINVLFCGRGANLQFACGTLLGLLWLNRARIVNQYLPGGAFTPIAAAVLCAFIYEYATPVLAFNPVNRVPVVITGPLEILLTTLLATIVVYSGIVAKQSGSGLAAIARVIGDASFSIYLSHNAFLLVLLEISKRVEIDAPLPLICVLFAMIATLCGIVVYYSVEKPLLRLISRKRNSPKLAPG